MNGKTRTNDYFSRLWFFTAIGSIIKGNIFFQCFPSYQLKIGNASLNADIYCPIPVAASFYTLYYKIKIEKWNMKKINTVTHRVDKDVYTIGWGSSHVWTADDPTLIADVTYQRHLQYQLYFFTLYFYSSYSYFCITLL